MYARNKGICRHMNPPAKRGDVLAGGNWATRYSISCFISFLSYNFSDEIIEEGQKKY